MGGIEEESIIHVREHATADFLLSRAESND